MDARPLFRVFRPLVKDTFRQARASGVAAIMLVVTALCSLLCLSTQIRNDVSLRDKDETIYFLPQTPAITESKAANLSKEAQAILHSDPQYALREGVETVRGRMTLAFGAISFPMTRERADAVRFLETMLAGGVAGTFGVLLTLVWTAGFVPMFLDPNAASVLLAKPASRTELLVGKYLSVLIFVGAQVTMFVVSTWLGLGLRTSVWDPTYLLCIPLLLLQFAIFYSFSIVMAVVARSTVASVFGSVLFWLLGWGINYASVMVRGTAESVGLPRATRGITDVAYWISPKPIDAALIVFNTLNARHDFEKPHLFQLIEAGSGFSPTWSLFSSTMLAACLLAIATYELNARDY